MPPPYKTQNLLKLNGIYKLELAKFIYQVNQAVSQSFYDRFSSVQLVCFMISSPLKASHIKTGVSKKVKAAKQYTLRHTGCLLHHLHTPEL